MTPTRGRDTRTLAAANPPGGPTRAERRRLNDQLICFVCRRFVAYPARVYYAPLDIVVHAGECADRADRALVDRSHSRRGRMRPRAVALALLAEGSERDRD